MATTMTTTAATTTCRLSRLVATNTPNTPRQPKHGAAKHSIAKYIQSTKPKVLLIDLDGVILKHNASLGAVKTSAEKMVAKIFNLSVDDPRSVEINRYLYQNFGHTLIGLKKVAGMDLTIDQFNNMVYTDDLLLTVNNLLTEDPPVPTVIRSIETRSLVNRCKREGIDYHVFTNSSMKWCDTVLNALNIRDVFPDHKIISSDHDVMHRDKCLKPCPKIYERIEAELFEGADISFVDDSITNLVNAPSNWNLFHMDIDFGTPISISSVTDGKRIHRISSLNKVQFD
jgi:FMN phosphatase YigB (HAD superfamily)